MQTLLSYIMIAIELPTPRFFGTSNTQMCACVAAEPQAQTMHASSPAPLLTEEGTQIHNLEHNLEPKF